jgi:ABC-2 type transport system permease protein
MEDVKTAMSQSGPTKANVDFSQMMKNFRERMVFVLAISRKEFKNYFFSPIFFVVAVVFLVLNGWLFILPFFIRGSAEVRDFFGFLPIVLALVIPMVTMRLFSEELNSGSFELLATLPITALEIVLGKFLASLYFVGLLLLPTLAYPITVEFVGDLSWGPVIGGYIGAILLGASYSAIGLFTSALTKNQIIALIVAAVGNIFLWLLNKTLILFPNWLASFFQYFSTDYHFESISKGVLDFRDIFYFLSLVFVFLYATRLAIEEK